MAADIAPMRAPGGNSPSLQKYRQVALQRFARHAELSRFLLTLRKGLFCNILAVHYFCSMLPVLLVPTVVAFLAISNATVLNYCFMPINRAILAVSASISTEQPS